MSRFAIVSTTLSLKTFPAGLSRVQSLLVAARNSCFAYQGRGMDVRQVGRELGVHYVHEAALEVQASACALQVS